MEVDADNATVSYNLTHGDMDAAAAAAAANKGYQKSMEFVFEVVLLSVVGVFGIVGNVAAVVLFSKQGIQLKFHRLMMMLAVFDLIYILLSLLLFTVPQVSPHYKTSGIHYHVLPRALPVAQIMLTGSIYSTLAVTVERYLTVCHPFFAFSHKWTSRWYIIIIVLFSLLYNAPKFFELNTGVSIVNETLAETGAVVAKTSFSIRPTAMRVNELYIKIYCIWMNFIFMGLLPFVLLIILNSLMLHNLVKQYRSSNAANLTLCNQKEIALAKVSLTIVIIFIVCHSVKWIPNLYELARLANEDKRAWPPWVESVTHISHFLMTLNSSTNFYIYCAKHYNVMPKLVALARGKRSGSASNDTNTTMLLMMNGRAVGEDEEEDDDDRRPVCNGGGSRRQNTTGEETQKGRILAHNRKAANGEKRLDTAESEEEERVLLARRCPDAAKA